MDITEVFKKQKEEKSKHFYPSISERKTNLIKLKDWILRNRQEIRLALFEDFKKPHTESDLTEIKIVLAEIDLAIANLKNWTKPKAAKSTLLFLGTKSIIKTEPAGVVLILAPWNFPFNLTVGPLVSAIAAGNSVIIKPSEFTTNTSTLIEKLVTDIFKPEHVFVFNGGPEIAEKLISLPFDHIFFTGSPGVGKKVMQAAAQNLTSVTLELGGQNPLVIHPSADLDDTVQKLVYGKCLNTGQSCLSPNIVYVPETMLTAFEKNIKNTFKKYYGPIENLKSNPDFGRIINVRHFDRLKALAGDAIASGGRELLGGEDDRSERFMPLNIIVNPGNQAKILQEEIFGPLLPVLTYKSTEDVYNKINSDHVPLAAYFFGKTGYHEFLSKVRSGSVVLNDTTLHFIHPNLPFGGKGYSGIGKAHGYAGFLAFSYQKSILFQRIGKTTAKLVYPPYTNKVQRFVELIFKWL